MVAMFYVTKLEPMYSRVYDDVEVINSNIKLVADILKETAERLLPCVQPKKRGKGGMTP